MGLTEDAVVKYVSKEATLIKRLGDLRAKIDKVYLNEGLSNMRSEELAEVNELKGLIGGDTNFDKIRALEQSSIRDYSNRNPAQQ